jgi:hypothetical protein
MASYEKINLYKKYKNEYIAPRKPALITISEAKYLGISGRGAPGGPEFTDKIGALYAMAFTIKMTRKFAGLQDYTVCKLEDQWWLDGPKQDFTAVSVDKWNWKLLIRTPDIIAEADLQKAASALIAKGKSPLVREVILESISEGLCVQMLHVGPYDRENKTIAVMKEFAEQKGLEFYGRHHEIYLSDPRRVPPDRLRTILREPVRTKGD